MSNVFQTHGAFSWQELMTSDVEESKAFYSKLLGWTFNDMSSAPGMTYSVISAGGAQIGGIMAKPPENQAPTRWCGYITVNDVDAIAARAKSFGATVLVPPHDIPGVGRFTCLQDPQGAVFSAIAYTKMG